MCSAEPKTKLCSDIAIEAFGFPIFQLTSDRPSSIQFSLSTTQGFVSFRSDKANIFLLKSRVDYMRRSTHSKAIRGFVSVDFLCNNCFSSEWAERRQTRKKTWTMKSVETNGNEKVFRITSLFRLRVHQICQGRMFVFLSIPYGAGRFFSFGFFFDRKFRCATFVKWAESFISVLAFFNYDSKLIN